MTSRELRLASATKLDRTGFTLLEVLLTSLLASVVLIALWSLSDIYLKMFATGRKKIEETQLVRGLTAQLAKDVSQVIQPTSSEVNSQPGQQFSETDSQQTRLPGTAESGSFDAARPGGVQSRDLRMQRPGSRNPNSPEQGRDRGTSDGGLRDARAGGSASTPRPRGITQNRGSNSGTSPLDPTGQNNSTINGFAITREGVVTGRMSSTVDAESDLPQAERMVPTFGLWGTSRSLRLVVLQADPQQNKAPTDLADLIPLPGQPRAPFATELKTILYTFALPTESTSNEAQHPQGLVRREWAWETWSGMQSTTLTETAATSSISDLPEWNSEDMLAFEQGRDVFHVPQVTGIEFRYYDGMDWEYEWDSEERKKLPVLVEVLFKIRTTGESSTSTSSSTESESGEMESEESMSTSDDSSSSSWSAGAGVVYRQLIHLPFAEDPPAEGTMYVMPQVPEMAGSTSVASPARNRQR